MTHDLTVYDALEQMKFAVMVFGIVISAIAGLLILGGIMGMFNVPKIPPPLSPYDNHTNARDGVKDE